MNHQESEHEGLKPQLKEAEAVVTKATETAKEVGDTLLGALASVERSIAETAKALEHAMHKAKDAEEIICLLKAQVERLRRSLSSAMPAEKH